MGGKGRGGSKGKGKGFRSKGAGKRGKGFRRPAARVARGPPRSGGRARPGGTLLAARPSFAGAPPPLPEDPTTPFLHPSARPLVKVPLEFSSLRHWCDVIGNNILAEFWHVFKEARTTFTGFGAAAGDELIIENAPPDGFNQCLLLIDRQPRIAASQRVLGVGRVAVKLRGGPARSGQVKSLGYIGSFLAEFAAALELRHLQPRDLTGPMRAILEPKVDLPGDYKHRPLNAALVSVNPSQKAAIEGLKHALEKIQGPPGTGKSTTIFHILDATLPPGQRVLVTCSRNVAVESIAQKLEGLDEWPLCVFGPRDRVGETARRHLLDSQVGGHFDERKVSRVAPLVTTGKQALEAAIDAKEAAMRGRCGERLLLAFLRKRHAAAYALRDLCSRLDTYCAAATSSPEWCRQQTQAGKEQVLARSRVFLCTIASTSRMLREWEEATGEDLRVHTVIVDECGCTPESSTALLLRLRPSNLVLVGDHKQLPPTSVVQPQILEGTGHTRSLLERCVLASGRVHQLREQYRMHPSIGGLVSDLFYAGRLLTPQSVAQVRRARESRPLVWMDVQGREEAPEKSYLNYTEVATSVKVCARLREQVGPEATIALLTFYKGQLEELMKALPNDLDIEVLTVDACQGSEFDYVVLSTVRANREQRLGFVKDPQRICVATSRSRLQLFIVGNRFTLAGDSDWKRVQEACQPSLPQEATPKRSLPAQGTFASVFDVLRQAKEREAVQKAKQAMEEQAGDGGGKGKRGVSNGSAVSYYGAESLMQQQGSFRSKYGRQEVASVRRRNDGSYQLSNATVIGGGFRRRVDIQELEATARAHREALEASNRSAGYQGAYRAPKSASDFQAHFPELGPDSAVASPEPSAPARAAFPMPRTALRLATRNDEKRARRAAQKAALAAEVSPVPFQPDLPSIPGGDEWEDINEAMLFEMFPDATAAVEESLLRFAGMPHQGARALEALLARPESKAVAEGEDELDYDCAPLGDEDWYVEEEEDMEDAYQDELLISSDMAAAHMPQRYLKAIKEDEDDGFWDERRSADEDCGACACCGEDAADGREAEDGLLYCNWCWAEWVAEGGEEEQEAVASAAALAAAERPAPPALPKSGAKPAKAEPSGNAPVRRWATSQAAAAASSATKVRSGGFFENLDGAPKWADTPARPEAGGKELVALKPKEERGEDDRCTRTSKRVDLAVPSAASLLPSKKEPSESKEARCRRLLSAMKSLEDDVADYITSLLCDDTSAEDVAELRDSVMDLLEGHGIARDAAEALWRDLVATT